MRRIVMMLVSVLIGFGLFIAILSRFEQKADTQSIPVLRERCSVLYDGSGAIRPECRVLIYQTIRNGQRPSHLQADQEGRVLWQ